MAGEARPSASTPPQKPEHKNDPPRPPPGQPPIASFPAAYGGSIPGPAPPGVLKPIPPRGSPPPLKWPQPGGDNIPFPRPPPGSPPSTTQQDGGRDTKRKRGPASQWDQAHPAREVGVGARGLGESWLSSRGEGSVPGLDQDTSGQEVVQKKPRTGPEEAIGLEDELELYSYRGPNTAAITAVCQGNPPPPPLPPSLCSPRLWCPLE